MSLLPQKNPNSILGVLSDPMTMGALGAIQGLFKAGQPSPYPTGLGNVLAQGVQGGLHGAMQGAQFGVMSQMKEAQLAEAKRQAEEAKRKRALEDYIFTQLGFNPFGTEQGLPLQAPQQSGLSPTSAEALNAPWAASPALSNASGGILNGGAPAPAAGTPSILGPGVDRRAALMTLSPTLAPLGKMIQDANKPTDKMREAAALGLTPGSEAFNAFVGTQYSQHGAWQVDPATGGIRLAPGYAQGMGDVATAEQGARAAFDVVEVPIPGGGTQQMTRAEAVRRLGGVAQPSPVSPAPSVESRPLAPQPGGGLGFRRPAAEIAADAEFQKTVAGEMAKNYADLQRADFNAPAQMAKYQRLQGLLSGVKTGKFTATTTQLKAAAKATGIDLEALGVTDDVAPAQAALALSNQLALELRNPAGGAGMPGALSDKDREFLVSMVPGLENDPAAIPLMIEYRQRIAQREQQVAKMARAYKKRTGKFDDSFYDELAEWSAKNPLFKESDWKKVPASGVKFLGYEGP